MNQFYRHRQGARPQSRVIPEFTGIDPLSNSDRYAAWISRLGRMPLQVSRPVYKWERKNNVVPITKENSDAA